ncbi:MAG: polysaccharide biosynthesis tyrosine autokinase [Hyphomonadaceae bacterium]|nr:polysaccharide biosynthesis tyrosine autokinase [Hyphomonadaceae bacterium]
MNLIALRQSPEELEPPTQSSQPEDSSEAGMFSVRWLVAFFARRWMLILSTAAVVFVICFAAFLFAKPKYEATALVLITPGQERVLAADQMVGNEGQGTPAAVVVDSQIEVLTSPAVMGRVVDALGLVNDPEWNPELPKARQSPLSYVRSSMFKNRTAPDQLRERVRQDVIERLAKAVTVKRRATSFAVEVSVSSHSPPRAAQIANKLVEVFLEFQLETRFQTTERANSWLSERLTELRRDVQAKEQASEEYKVRSGLISAGGGLLSEQQTSELQAAVMTARTALAEKEARYRQVEQLISAGGSADSIAGVIDSQVITQLRARESDIARRQADLESRYGELHPAVQNVRAEREDIKAQINGEVARFAASLRNEVAIARTGVATMEHNLAAARGTLTGNQDSQVRLRELERDAAAARAVYESFLQRFHEITNQGQLRTTSAQLVSAATMPTKRSSPDLKMAFLVALGLGFAIGIAVGFLAESLDEGFRTAEEVERKVGLPALATVPKLRPGDFKPLPPSSQHPAGYLVERQMSAFTEALRVLRSSILYGRLNQKTQVLAVSSALPDEGKTTVSLCLARVSALSGQRVLLIDCDLRRRTLKDVLGLEPALGLLQVLSGEANWRQTIFVDEASGMHLLPLKDSGFTPKDIFGTDAMNNLLTELRGTYDLIVMDCAPVLAVADTRVLVSMADTCIVVARWEKTPVRAVKSALQQVQSAGANLAGVVLNHVDTRVPGYAYKMKGYYGA